MSSDPTDHAGRGRPFWGERTRPQAFEALAQCGSQEDQSSRRPFSSEAHKVEIDDGCEPTTVRASRHGGDFYRDGINPEVGFTGYRPPGADLVYKPHVALRPRREPMQRINGGESHPQAFENRHLLHDTRYPWGCIGRVTTNQSTGSGVLVGRNLVVTAAHVIPWDSNRPIFFDTNHIAEPGLTANVVEVRGYDTVLTGYDWAIMKLNRPLGANLGFMGFNGYSADWEDDPVWTIVGYPTGLGPFWQQGISVDDDDEDDNGGQEFESKNADTFDGDSGGPMFALWGSDPRVIGVVSGVASEIVGGVNHIIAGGSGLGDLIAWGRSNW